MAELLLELLSEEIPARMQDRAAEDLASLVRTLLTDAGIGFDAPIERFATPRRLAIQARGLPTRQADRRVERRGPRADAPEQAREGFLRSLAGSSFRLEERDDKKGKVLFALVEEPGRSTGDVLAEGLPEALARFPWPKTMRWGGGEVRWVRPLESILCLLDGAVVPFAFAGIESGAETVGHRFMAPARLAVRGFDDCRAKLREARVVLDGEERKRLIHERSRELAASQGLRLREDEGLLDELKGLVEWPVPLLGRIEPSFMELPPEVLVTSMRTHQRYLALEDGEGRLAPFFVAVANIEADHSGAAIVQGNERVLRARLWDARFFWEQDRKRPLEDGLAKLETMVFHAELGSQGERVRRLVALADTLRLFVEPAGRAIGPDAGATASAELAAYTWRAALLAKADLVTGLVGEFPELQGVVGGRIAKSQGEPDSVVAAIAEHYSPKGSDDRCPSGPVSMAVALADRLDTLVGFFAIGQKPTGSKDPFALRRAALGVVRIILDEGLYLPLRWAFQCALKGYAERLSNTDGGIVVNELMNFVTDRLKVHLRTQGVRHDLIAAVYGAKDDDDLVRLVDRARALQEFLTFVEGRNLLAGYRRASSIVAIETKKDGRAYDQAPEPELLREPTERALFAALEDAERDIGAALAIADFRSAMRALARLRVPIDAFFEQVMVNAPETELRANRLRMLNRIRGALGAIADFSLIEDTGQPV